MVVDPRPSAVARERLVRKKTCHVIAYISRIVELANILRKVVV